MKDRRTLNKEMFEDTMSILRRGSYEVNGKKVTLKLSQKEMEDCIVLLPEQVKECMESSKISRGTVPFVLGRNGVDCENSDSYAAARAVKAENVLVLNFANAIHPGGGVLNGATAQEEDLCRKSSLYCSLSSNEAKKYYRYNYNLHTEMGSDAMILTPKVEIIKDETGNLLEETSVVAVLTCAAPNVAGGYEGKSEEEYRKMVYDRIVGILKCAAYYGYERLILGAWGCGAFDNDPAVISDLFYQALKELDYNGVNSNSLFRSIVFAVWDHSPDRKNLKEFYRNFGGRNYWREEDHKAEEEYIQRQKENEIHLDQIKGCLLGGAIGDALGYPVEFLSEGAIFQRYGNKGITEYEPDHRSGNALISDDTQMTLFTASGLLVGDTRGALRGIMANPSNYVEYAYLDWLRTQEMSYEEGVRWMLDNEYGNRSWLSWIKELYSRRAPGNTCLSALYQRKENIRTFEKDYIEHPLNHSKGCGGIMRVAPLALCYETHDIKDLDEEGAQIAAITHGHSLGYLPAAVLTHIIHRIVYSQNGDSLKEIVLDARDTVKKMYRKDKYIQELTDIINLAVKLSENNESDLNNIHQIGEGWVAEETLGIAIYCALRYQNDFSKGVIAAVNHKGDSDSTGAVTGNILGALLGFHGIEEKWKKNLELYDIILETAEDLCHKCQMSEYGEYHDEEWSRKYIDMCYTKEQKEMQENVLRKRWEEKHGKE